jgi:hypothetical protein
MTYESSGATCDVSLAPFGLRIIRAMQPSGVPAKTAERVAKQLYTANRMWRVLFAHCDGGAAETGVTVLLRS